MDDLLAARSQMAVSLGFHIVFAVAGMAMPLLMIIAEGLWLKTREPAYLDLAHRWAKGTAALFAVGAVSGTVLSFELGLLWPRFMAFAGPIIGMPFSLEGFAFFFEAVFLGIYLYGEGRVSERAHWLSGLAVLVSGVASGAFVVAANAWMNSPAGFTLEGGNVVSIDPWAAMFNPAFAHQAVHMTLAAFVSVGFAVAGIHAFLLLRDPLSKFHRAAYAAALLTGGAASLVQPLAGHWAAQRVAATQPLKLAAMEGQWETERRAPLRLFGLPDAAAERTRWSLEVPGLLSWLAYGDADAEVKGLKSAPAADRPPAAVVHVAFQLMVAAGTALAAVSLIGAALAWRGRGPPLNRLFLKAVVLASPLGFLALEAGWVVTEVGRQPWIIKDVLRVKDALTPMPGLAWTFALTTALYLVLLAVSVETLRRLVAESRDA